MNKGGNILFGLKRKETYVAFMAGKVLPLEMVKDPVFSKKIMGMLQKSFPLFFILLFF